MNAICAIEELTGLPFLEALDLLGFEANGENSRRLNLGKLQLRGLRLFLWAALLDDDPALTIQQTGRLMPGNDRAKMMEITQKVMEAWGPAWGGEGSNPPSPFSESDGSTSGPSDDTTSA